MRHAVAEVNFRNPIAERAVEPLVGKSDGAVVVAVAGRDPRQAGAFAADGAVTMLSEEAVEGLALPPGDNVVQPLGDTNRGVVVADLGRVVQNAGSPPSWPRQSQCTCGTSPTRRPPVTVISHMSRSPRSCGS